MADVQMRGCVNVQMKEYADTKMKRWFTKAGGGIYILN
jgi:hypothetical protein